jgi:exonuclease III
MVLLSWNVAGRVARLPEQIERVLRLDADVVCLQEITPTTAGPWREALTEHGYMGVAQAELAPAGRTLAVLTASRLPVVTLPVAGLPLPERVLAVSLSDATEVVNVHSPISTRPDLAKVLTHEAVHRHMTRPPAGRRGLVCGDFNTPRKEHADGRVWTFARDRYGRLRPERGERWDAAELALIRGLEPHGFRDAFRALHGYDRRELSWSWPRHSGGYRLDHLIVGAGIDVQACSYEHAWRERGLSDHSPLVARLDLSDARD